MHMKENMVSSLKYIDTYSFKLGNFEAPLRYFKLTRNFYIDFICALLWLAIGSTVSAHKNYR